MERRKTRFQSILWSGRVFVISRYMGLAVKKNIITIGILQGKQVIQRARNISLIGFLNPGLTMFDIYKDLDETILLLFDNLFSPKLFC